MEYDFNQEEAQSVVKEPVLASQWYIQTEVVEIDDIWAVSGFKSRSSIFRILRKYGITLNRGPHSGPIKKWNERKNPIIKEDKQ